MRPAPSDPPEIEAILWNDFGGDVAWYVGANTGQSLNQLRRRFRHIVAFEPAEECWGYLDGQPGVQLVTTAVSDIDGDIQLAAPPSKIATGQLVTPGTIGMEWDANESGTEVRTITARTIDTLTASHPPPSFLLIDVEGHEGRVLVGAFVTLHRYRPSLLVEFHTPDLHDFCTSTLQALRYDVQTVRHPHYARDSHMWHQHGWLRAFPQTDIPIRTA